MEIACIIGFVAIVIIAAILHIMIRELDRKVDRLQTAVEATLVSLSNSCNSLLQLMSRNIDKKNPEG